MSKVLKGALALTIAVIAGLAGFSDRALAQDQEPVLKIPTNLRKGFRAPRNQFILCNNQRGQRALRLEPKSYAFETKSFSLKTLARLLRKALRKQGKGINLKLSKPLDDKNRCGVIRISKKKGRLKIKPEKLTALLTEQLNKIGAPLVVSTNDFFDIATRPNEDCDSESGYENGDCSEFCREEEAQCQSAGYTNGQNDHDIEDAQDCDNPLNPGQKYSNYDVAWGLHQNSVPDSGATPVPSATATPSACSPDNQYGINAQNAWEHTTGVTDGADRNGVAVAICDTGLDDEHPDLKENVIMNLNFTNDSDDDFNGHGTHCSGTIGARGNNAKGHVGVNWRVSMIGCKIGGEQGANSISTSAAIEAFNQLAQVAQDRNEALTVSNSWGGPVPNKTLYDTMMNTSDVLQFVVAAHNQNVTLLKGPCYVPPPPAPPPPGGCLCLEQFPPVPVAQIPGTIGCGLAYPAGFSSDWWYYDGMTVQNLPPVPGQLTVGAMAKSGDRASFSNVRPEIVQIGAPGKDILSTWTRNQGPMNPAPTPKVPYKIISGTSMATPHIAGALALCHVFNRQWSPTTMKEFIMENAINSPPMSIYWESGTLLDLNELISKHCKNSPEGNTIPVFPTATRTPNPFTPTPGFTPPQNNFPTPTPTPTKTPTATPTRGSLF